MVYVVVVTFTEDKIQLVEQFLNDTPAKLSYFMS